ncbi:CoA transferase [Streptosporangium fragile]|uniref:CoA transferase n=1 Tax=Streptosporangium fragile TaxID=46186 RepID=A0ABN3VTN0_9ACTN
MLEHIRVLDLTDERGLMCGRLLADLGADVVQVEPVGGSTARSAPPTAGDGPGRSMFWQVFAANKRGVALDLDDETGLSALRRLARRADVFVTSMPPAWLRERGLDPDTLRASHPGLVYVAISAFGRSGPKAEYADSDLVVWAAGGPLDPHRDGDRPPLRISVPQAFLHASADAAAGALLAILQRGRSGLGQVVDVSAQASLGVATLARVLAHAVGDARPEWHRKPVARTDAAGPDAARTDQSGSGAATPNTLKKWRCKDGLVELHLSMGPAAGGFTNNLFGWLLSEGAVDERVASWDWRTMPDLIARGELTDADLDEARHAVREFLATRTKSEVLDAAIERRLLCMAIFDMADISAAPHLEQRGFWADVPLGETTIRIPGAIARVGGDGQPGVRRPAPRTGQHNDEVLADWLTAAAPDGPGRPGGRTPGGATTPRPLDGLKVLDLSWVVAGPLIGRALADFGARVVRVESSRRVETARLMQPFHGGVPGVENSALYGNCNAGKLGMTVDLSTEDGRAVVRDLARWADVVVESFSPGQMAKWGLDYGSLSRENPALVMLSTSIAGQSGPWSRLAGYGNVGASLSGYQTLVGWEDALPLGPFGPYTDYVGPRLALATLLAAVEDGRRTGTGRYIDVAQVEAGIFFLSPQVAHHGADGTVAGRRGNRDAVYAPHGVYPCAPEGGADRFVAIAVRDDDEWLRLAEAMGRTDLAGRADLRTAAGRRADEDLLDRQIAAWTETRPAAEVERLLQAAGVPAHVSASSADVAADPQLAYRGHFVRLPHPVHGETVVEGPRYLLSETPGGPAGPAPTLGRDNEFVLREILGYPDEEIARLTDGGVLT